MRSIDKKITRTTVTEVWQIETPINARDMEDAIFQAKQKLISAGKIVYDDSFEIRIDDEETIEIVFSSKITEQEVKG